MRLADKPSNAVDMDDGLWYAWMQWSPDRELNPQYEGIPDVKHFALIFYHPTPDGGFHEASLTVKGPVQEKLSPDKPKWDVIQMEPLTLSPSILCTAEKGGCGAHGHIREGKWVA